MNRSKRVGVIGTDFTEESTLLLPKSKTKTKTDIFQEEFLRLVRDWMHTGQELVDTYTSGDGKVGLKGLVDYGSISGDLIRALILIVSRQRESMKAQKRLISELKCENMGLLASQLL